MAQDGQYEDIAALRRRGYRLTPQRLLILDVVKTRSEHLSAEAIHAEVAARYPVINLATVYRNLQWLQEAGLIRKIDIGCGHLLWEYSGDGHHHHLICQSCGSLQEIDNHVVECLSDHVRDHYGFAVNLDHLAIFGRCVACQDGEQGAPGPT
ncbi:MAG TPA: Fur family transcriptional regulator [Herpetosiphonaceae bacterium]|jgi:Fur family ferric uptake transcriptional regulator|nr:Fur family transcriptional regulator [Herpetosiphonaceae bacterium]